MSQKSKKLPLPLSQKEQGEIKKLIEAGESPETIAQRYNIPVEQVNVISQDQSTPPETPATTPPPAPAPAVENGGADDQPKTGWKKWLTRIFWAIGIITVLVLIAILVIPWKSSPPPRPQPLVVSITDINSGNPLANAYLYDNKGQLLGRSQNTGEIQLPLGAGLTQQFKVEKESYLPLESFLPQNNCFKLSQVTAVLHYTSFKPFTMIFQGEGFNKIISDDARNSGDVKIPINTWVTVVIKIGTPNQWHRANIFLNSSQDGVIVDITENHEESVTIIRSQWTVNSQSPNTRAVLPYGSYIIKTEFTD